MARLDDQLRPLGFKRHAKVQGFRFGTALLAWLVIGVAFYYRPDLI